MDKLVLLYVVIGLIVTFIFFWRRERFTANVNTPTTLINDIDTSNIPLYKRVGGPSKCYSCETDAFNRSCGNSYAAISTRPLKYYEGMPLPEIGYARMGYMS
jgi:hypothetical protein